MKFNLFLIDVARHVTETGGFVSQLPSEWKLT